MEIKRKPSHAGMICVGLGAEHAIFFSRELFFPTLNFLNVRSFIGIVNLRKNCNLRKMANLNLRKTIAKLTFSKSKGFWDTYIFLFRNADVLFHIDAEKVSISEF